MELKTKITFEINESKTYIAIMRDGKKIGQIYSQDESITCLNSIQICGFDRQSPVWACGPFAGKKDTVFYFMPTDDEWFAEKAKQYADYVQNYFKADVKEIKTGCETMQYAQVKKDETKDFTKLKSFADWLNTGCAF